MNIKRGYSLATIILVGGCTTYGAIQLEQRFGAASPRERVVESLPPDSIDYWTEVKPVVEKRCVVCHGCFDAPCQLKMSSIEGTERGATAVKVYNQSRLKHAPMTRLHEDAHSVGDWRQMGFFPVLNEYEDTPEANREAGVMYRILKLKDDNPLPNVKQLSEKTFDLSLDRNQFCARPETFDRFAQKHPLWGMPYALPGLPGAEQDTLMRWIEQGAHYTARPAMHPAFQGQIDRWEKFLNGDSLKEQLTSRYIFEHLAFAHLYFPEVDETRFFQLVRSATPPGEPLQLIATRRPFNDPGVPRVYYRIMEYVDSIVVKIHMPYRLDAARIRRWQSLFLDPHYEVTALPSYEEQYASNPFITFEELPVNARYRFMLEEAQFTIMGFIKGPVCRGHVALSVISDDFWVFFINPDRIEVELFEDFLANLDRSYTMPASSADIYNLIGRWRKYAKQQREMLAAKDQFLLENLGAPDELNLDLIWDGDGDNQNAALTIYRHFDSATVEKGLLGQPPKTAWVIGYTLLERIHYLLVAGYDVYGNVGHQLVTRLYMDFLRMEGESNFLLLLPESARNRERNFWYRNVKKEQMEYLTLPRFEQSVEPSIPYKTDDQKSELFAMLEEKLKLVLPQRHKLAAIENSTIRNTLVRLTQLTGRPATLMPEAAFVRIEGRAGDQYVSLIRNSAHLNMTSMFKEQKNRVPAEDTLSVIPGFIGSYPNALYVVQETSLAKFVNTIANLKTEEDYASFLDDFGIRRTDPDFWRNSDALHLAFRQADRFESGLLDYSRLENR